MYYVVYNMCRNKSDNNSTKSNKGKMEVYYLKVVIQYVKCYDVPEDRLCEVKDAYCKPKSNH